MPDYGDSSSIRSLDDIDRWVREKASSALEVTAFSPNTGASLPLAPADLAEVLTLLLDYDAAKAAGGDLKPFDGRFADLGLNAALWDAPTRRSRPLYASKGGGVDFQGYHLKSLLETARDAARDALGLPRSPRLHAWDVEVYAVDDSDTARAVMGFMLGKLGYKADLFDSAEELIKKIDTMMPDLPHLILMDLMMPKVNGLELTRELQVGSKRQIPIVFVTGRKMDSKVVDELRGEPNVKDFLPKPVTEETLGAVIRNALTVRVD